MSAPSSCPSFSKHGISVSSTFPAATELWTGNGILNRFVSNERSLRVLAGDQNWLNQQALERLIDYSIFASYVLQSISILYPSQEYSCIVLERNDLFNKCR